jgi:hypothetical protein
MTDVRGAARDLRVRGEYNNGGSMSRAFVKESEGEWLGDVSPEVSALERFLTRENEGVGVELVRQETDADGLELYEMSNGNCYYLDEDKRWRLK